jgi:hypothetical protein
MLKEWKPPKECDSLNGAILNETAVPIVLWLAGASEKGNESAEIGAGAESLVAGARDDGNTEVVILGVILPGVGKADDHLRIHGVADLGTVQGDVGDVVALVVDEGWF